MMTEQIIITSKAKVSIKPLVESALKNEVKTIRHGIQRTRKRLAAFETKYDLHSDQFEKKFNAGEIEETLDIIDWLMEIQALRLLEEQYQALDNAILD